MRLVEYLRVSTDDKGQDPARQQGPNRDRAAKDGHEIVGTVIDNKGNHKSSGTIPAMAREGFLEAVKLAKEVRAGGILVENVDRLTRSGWKDLGATLYLLEVDHGLKVIFADLGGTDVDDPGNGLAEVVVPLAAYLARLTSQRLSATTKTGMSNARRRKHDPGQCEACKVGYWCPVARQGRPPKEEPTEEEWVLYDQLVARGWGLRRVALAMTEQRLKEGGRDGSPVVDAKARRQRTVSESLLRDWAAKRVGNQRVSTRFVRPCHPQPRPKGPLSTEQEAEATTAEAAP